jgi:hypothetical protein
MIENIIEDGLNDFFFVHICKYWKAGRCPFILRGVAFAYRDVIAELCKGYELSWENYPEPHGRIDSIPL